MGTNFLNQAAARVSEPLRCPAMPDVSGENSGAGPCRRWIWQAAPWRSASRLRTKGSGLGQSEASDPGPPHQAAASSTLISAAPPRCGMTML